MTEPVMIPDSTADRSRARKVDNWKAARPTLVAAK